MPIAFATLPISMFGSCASWMMCVATPGGAEGFRALLRAHQEAEGPHEGFFQESSLGLRFTEVPAGFWWVGGRSDATHVSPSGAFLVHVSIPEGYMDQPTKGGVQADVTAAILATIGVAPGDGHSVQVILDEVGEGDWAAGGRTISIASIADTVGLAKSGDRFAWVRAYFTAKARTFAAAGYPKGTGGLLPDSASDRAGQAPNGAA